MAGLLKRLITYQKERFPILVHLPLIAAFSFSAIGYSRACRGAAGFIALPNYLTCVLTNVILFFMLRVADEHKDHEDDMMYRIYLPVPRGLISLKELSRLAKWLFAFATFINVLLFPSLLGLYALMMAYLLLMRYEFFIPNWLKKHQVAYIVSHMLIIPLADIYASSYDWKLGNAAPPSGLLFFFAVSFFNGISLEIGRKIRIPEKEEPGVLSYTKLWGLKTAPLVWMLVLAANFAMAWICLVHAHYGSQSFYILSVLFLLSCLPALLFVSKPSYKKTKLIELISLVWAIGMYLLLGGIPLLIQLLSR
ncbi:MAG: hypothetical protein EOP51_02300 [Sphingobacteriales bacterium]|nr:MAG: hypothetical protein EOP51_02300 [Sphingobacteriales bacterium]